MARGERKLAGAAWLRDPVLRDLLLALEPERARIVGGAVRNALMGRPVTDIDIATTWRPEEVMARARAMGFSVHPVGLAHGSVVVAKDNRAFEVTTLRRDIETDGRHAVVAYTADWAADARRRDFTINALYADIDGRVHDPVGGLADLEARRVRFIGDPYQRIREDYLRILRFFRFFAQYARGKADAPALAAIEKSRVGLAWISRERIGAELRKLMVAPRALDAVELMLQTGVIHHLLGEHCRHDLTALRRMVEDDAAHDLAADWLLRLAALCGAARELKESLRLSREEARRIGEADKLARQDPPREEGGWKALAWRHGREVARDAARLMHARAALDDAAFTAVLALLADFAPPAFLLRGSDVLALGIEPGEEVGRLLRAAEERWVAQGFQPPDRDGQLALLRAIMGETA